LVLYTDPQQFELWRVGRTRPHVSRQSATDIDSDSASSTSFAVATEQCVPVNVEAVISMFLFKMGFCHNSNINFISYKIRGKVFNSMRLRNSSSIENIESRQIVAFVCALYNARSLGDIDKHA